MYQVQKKTFLECVLYIGVALLSNANLNPVFYFKLGFSE
jgi:hypothetical protein